MKKRCDVKRFGKENSHGWHREELVSKAREFLRLGGAAMKVRVMVVREGRASKRPVIINSPADAFKMMRRKALGLDREHFWCVHLDARHRVLSFEVVSIGTLTASLVSPRELYKSAILQSAAGVAVFHNHPSQDPTPSAEDREVTKRIKTAGELLGIPLIDHVVLTDEKYFSFKQEGLL